MDFEEINIQDLKPAAYNPRIMPPEEYTKLENSLNTFGLVDPIIIDLKHDHTIIGGHQRYEVLLEQDNEQTLRLIRLGDIGLILRETSIKIKDENDQKALNLALNKITGEWDYSLVDMLLSDLSEDHYNIELTGFTENELLLNDESLTEFEDLFPDGNEFPTDKEITNTNENNEKKPSTTLKQVKTIIKDGEKYMLGNHILLCADMKQIDNIKNILCDEKIDLVLTDPQHEITIMQTNTDED